MPEWLKDGKVALITGGSSGIGFALARALLQRNMDVILLARRQQLLNKAKEELNEGERVTVISADVTSVDSLMNAAKLITKSHSSIDLLVNCAGIVKPSLLKDLSFEEINDHIQVNLIGVINVVKIFQEYIPRGGAILNVSSGMVFFGIAGYTAYNASKTGIMGFFDPLRRELLSRGITVHVVCPWDVDTPQYRKEQEEMPEWMKGSIRPKSMNVDIAVKRIIKGLIRNRFLIRPNFMTKFSSFMQRHLPPVWRFIIDRAVPKP